MKMDVKESLSKHIFHLNDDVSTAVVGGKFYQLTKLHKKYPIPRGICLATSFFRQILASQPEIHSALQKLIGQIYQSRAYQLDKYTLEIKKIIDGLILPSWVASVIKRHLKEAMDDQIIFPLAVRSSAVSEDKVGKTQAGIYDSLLNLNDWDATIAAVMRCWASYYSHRAITHRILLNQTDPEPCMAVIIQEMIQGIWSGIAFSRVPTRALQEQNLADDSGYIEYMPGDGDAIAGGEKMALGVYFQVDKQGAHLEKEERLPVSSLTAVADAARIVHDLEKALGTPIDLEWTWTPQDGLYILQARPAQINNTDNNLNPRPFLKVWDICTMPSRPGFEMRDCTSVYMHWSHKRGRQRSRAIQAGIALGHAFAIEANLKGALLADFKNDPILKALLSKKLILDASCRLRQLEINGSQLKSRLIELLESSPNSPWAKHTFLLREYIKGCVSLLSTISHQGDVFVEFSLEPLPELNRGFTKTWHISISPQGKISSIHREDWPADILYCFDTFEKNLPVLAEFTRSEEKIRKGVCLEWVIEKEQLTLIDASYPNGESDDTVLRSHRCLSPGYASGKILKLEINDWLNDLSNSAAISLQDIPSEIYRDKQIAELLNCIHSSEHHTILSANRPVASLAVFIGHVHGFVFEDGPLLCHLGILLRERQIPGIFLGNVYSQIQDGQDVSLMNDHMVIRQQ